MAKATQTTWMPLVRPDAEKLTWLLDDGTIMTEPELEVSSSMRRVRLKALPKLADYYNKLDDFLGTAAQEAARLQGSKVWMALGNPKHNPMDADSSVEKLHLRDFNKAVQPHFMDPNQGSFYRPKKTEVAWRFRHETLPIEAQIECVVTKGHYDNFWTVNTRMIWPSTSPLDGLRPTFLNHDNGTHFRSLIANAGAYTVASTRASQWAHANPIDWCDGFSFGAERFDTERQAINHFAKVIREIGALDEIDIPNLLGLDEDAADFSGITTLTLRLYRSNASQDLLDSLTDYVSGTPIVERIQEKWLELMSLFRSVGMVLGDVHEQDWWRFIVEGASADPVEVTIGPVEDEEGQNSSRHAVKINLATGTIVVACSARATSEEAAIAWETAKIKAKLTGEEDELLAYAKRYAEQRNTTVVNQLMDSALQRAKTN